jgi:hypothetical protein
MAPQIIYLSVLLISLLISANQHGKPKEGNYNFWTNLLAYTIGFIIVAAGGFFDVFFNN